MKNSLFNIRIKFVTFIIILNYLSTLKLNSQSRIIFYNNAYLVISGNRYLVINNSNANAITLSGSGGNIVSEGENNRVKWNIGTATGSYTVPFTKSVENKITLVKAGVIHDWLNLSSLANGVDYFNVVSGDDLSKDSKQLSIE